MSVAPRFSGPPDWVYLLQEFHDFYFTLAAGGSRPIRAHQRRVRARITNLLRGELRQRTVPPEPKPVTAHLRRALDAGKSQCSAPLIRAIEAVAPELRWEHGYEKMPRGLAEKYAFAEFAGPRGPIESPDLVLGIVLFAPGCIYPAHAHADITESYVCLSGATSENDTGVYGPGSLIFNAPGHMHRITVSDREPSLLAWAWEGPAAALAGNKLEFPSRRPR